MMGFQPRPPGQRVAVYPLCYAARTQKIKFNASKIFMQNLSILVASMPGI